MIVNNILGSLAGIYVDMDLQVGTKYLLAGNVLSVTVTRIINPTSAEN